MEDHRIVLTHRRDAGDPYWSWRVRELGRAREINPD